jgi:diguanylate cyclase (GGDEF)-like protein/PAS domain S-box-containing protein
LLDSFYKSNISAKLNAFLVLPIVTLLFFSSIAIFDKFKQLKQTQEAVHFSEVVQDFTLLVYNLQEERGLSAGVLSAKKKDYQFQLAKQRKVTTGTYSKIARVFLKPPPYLPKKTILNLQLIGQKFKQLNFIRADIDNLIDNKFFDFYSLLISELLQEINVLHAMATSQETNYMVSSLIYALGLEEYAAIERGLLHGMLNVRQGSNGYTENSIPLSVVNHVARQQAELSRFYNVASPKHSTMMFEAIDNKKIQKFYLYRELTIKTIEQRNSFDNIVSESNFNALVHDYNNYIIGGDGINATQIKVSFYFLLKRIESYTKLLSLNLEDQKHLRVLLSIIHQYESNIDIVTKLKQQKTPIVIIEEKVKVDPSPALKAISKLKHATDLMDPEQWWEVATKRLSALQNVSSIIINDIIDLEKTTNKQLKTPLVFYTLTVLMVLAIASLLSQMLKGRLVERIKYIACFMKESRITNQNNQLLEISGQDEITVMTNEFNQLMIERSSNEEQLKLAAQVFIEAHDGIFITQTDGTIIDVNPAFCQITGYNRKEVLGKNPRILNSQKQSKAFYTDMWDCLIAHGYWKGEVWNRKKNGELYAEILTISSLKDNSGKTLHYMGLFADITQIKNQQRTLEQMAHYDALTLLPNRTLFVDRFNQAIAHADRTKRSLAVCFIDLDNFKLINDHYGHDVGDKVLIEVAERFKSSLRGEDSISRQGGDEFALLLSDIQTFADCEDILKRIRYSLAKPLLLDGICHTITASIGVTLYPKGQGEIDTLIRHADQAMYQVKLAGGDGYHLFNEEKDQQIIKKQHELNKIINAIKNEEFTLYYQPKVNMKTGEMYGVEALVRWDSPENGIISPMNFLPVLEGTEVEIQFGQWVINNAIKQLSQWQRAGLLIEVSINISSYHLQSATFIDDLKGILSKYEGLDTSFIQLEILESSVLGDLNAISNTLNTCRDMFGLQVALDDFGTGYSSLTHIKSLPANVIKIDQSFVIGMLHDANNYSIINGVLGLAKSFSRDVIAEGVESTAHGLMLLMMGCEKAQGYGIARPMPVSDFNHWLASYQPNDDWIAWANETHHQKDSKLKVFDIALQYEFTALSKRISSPRVQEGEQVKQHQNRVCAGWLNRNKQKKVFSKDWLTELENAYQLMHHSAEALYQNQSNSKTDNTISNLEKIKSSFDDVVMVMSRVP